MKITRESSEKAIQQELGARVARHRLNRNQTQEALAEEAGVSLRTVTRIESGQSVQLTNLIRLLRALDLLENLEVAVPAPPPSPIQQVKLRGRQRERASSAPHEPTSATPWTWGDDR
jgi:putative transcriptional regulator